MRTLGWFWTALVFGLVTGAAVLQSLGPPPGLRTASASASVSAPMPPPEDLRLAATSPAPASDVPSPRGPGRSAPGVVRAPDPALLQPSPAGGGAMLPKISADGRLPMQEYARGFDPADRHPKIGLVLAGVGLNQADSLDAIRALPGEVTLAVSPYASRAPALLDSARMAQHELLISLPLEPNGWYVDDPGDHTLLVGAAPAQNQERLDWALGRIQGYVGATGALGQLRGERFAGAAEQMGGLLDQLAARGLMYLDARTGAGPLPHVWSRGVDVFVDEAEGVAEIRARLDRLEQIARERGSAVGLIGAVRPGTTALVAAWAQGLPDRQVALAPVSALAGPPASQ